MLRPLLMSVDARVTRRLCQLKRVLRPRLREERAAHHWRDAVRELGDVRLLASFGTSGANEDESELRSAC